MCMDFAPGGDLLGLITSNHQKKLEEGKVDECCDAYMTQFYIAEIVEAVEYLHGLQILHRDLKPESTLFALCGWLFNNWNHIDVADILLDATGHIKVTDFGTSTMGSDDTCSRNSFVGTQDYVSPEVLSGERQATKACDLWAVGCIIFQMLSGRSPFRAMTEYLTFEMIMGHCKGSRPLVFPDSIPPDAKDIILAFLRVSDTERLGAGDDERDCNGYCAVKQHAYFAGTPWGELVGRPAPFQPDPSKFPSTDNMRDGALDEWDLEGDPTPIDDSRHNQQHSSSGSSPRQKRDDGDSDLSSGRELTPQGKVHKRLSAEFDTARSSEKWKRFLYEGEKQVFTGTLYKRRVGVLPCGR